MIVGSGIDVIEIARIERLLNRNRDRFERRIFTSVEIADCHRFRRDAPQFALRFAAKEALMKAVGTGWRNGVRWVDIETHRDSQARSGSLCLTLSGRVAEIAQELGAGTAHLAVSRTRSHAMAVVLLEARGAP
ncbi:MAG TPA: holo-ACP synthase [Myxococcota bacterium]|nr:holo-ACP synthase [Myxococcota bacterium]